MKSNKKYWKGLEELKSSSDFVEKNKNEFAEEIPLEDVLSEGGLNSVTPRRDFLKALGFGLGAVSLAACQTAPIRKSIPYLIKPEEITPGVANYYVSSFHGQSILVKTREGRPIKIEANPAGLFENTGTDAVTQAAVLDLYDVSKLKGPVLNKAEVTWDNMDLYVKGELNKLQASGKKIRLVSATVTSPSTKAVIADFITQFPNTMHVQVDAVSYSGVLQANAASFGKAVLPRYRFDRADVIVSVAADFLGTWIAGEEYSRQYVGNRNSKSLKKGKMSRHIQFETGMSMTGTNADSRIPVKPSEQGPAIIALYNEVTGSTLSGAEGLSANAVANTAIKLAAKELVQARGRALVVCGSNDVSMQTLVNAINSSLGSYGTTIDLDNPHLNYAGNDAVFASFISEMNRGEVGAVFLLNTNPAYSYFNARAFTDALSKVPLRVSFSDREDETASLCNVLAPNSNFLESWGDESAVDGYYTVVQPTINPVFNTRQAEQSLLAWSSNSQKNYYQYVKSYWEKNILPTAGKSWKQLLQTGFAYTGEKPAGTYVFSASLPAIAQTIVTQSKTLAKDIEIHLYQSMSMRDGRYANNAFLQELPDPVSKVTWDNYAAVAPKYAEEQGWSEFDKIEIKGANGHSITLPVLLQPGQARGTISIAVGYGREKPGQIGKVGENAYPFATSTNGSIRFFNTATVTKTGEKYELAQTQTHHSYEGRDIVRETSFASYVKDPHSGTGKHAGGHHEYDLWPEHKKIGHNWVMAIDLNACTGCGACIVACNVENNIPVVGRDEVRNRREMHWLRIDRYYSFKEGEKSVTEEKEIEKLENMDDISVVHQPMLCQHCDHAPCETVCPVIATMHSSDGLNHMAYNRCVGTRYCANNCPYKVRRFNWFNYWNDSRFDNYLNNEFTQLLLNPDVTTRSRGVMEKCSMCIQRIQAGRLKAKLEKRPLVDGEIQMACQQACSANAIIFGDLNDPNSAVSNELRNERTYYVLEEINTQPGVGYQTKVRNVVEA
ncbi:TAT-variant-translocated molybdopterin oxidoreductase [Arcticibacter eurypsychrophilus]|uniref:TAT-variant-translocated molybdopterin oxidoreductase n=1 Tax=Arcticibacter eurypsychrophilus TaxID=1434752 RepID=UPI00084DAE14|nr:TAT-variant-translocated molybdopterin oxidoreductase [Arcticibacter eurypsychrophilus]